MKVGFFTPTMAGEGISDCSFALGKSLTKLNTSVEFIANNLFDTSNSMLSKMNPFYFIYKAMLCWKYDVLFIQFNAQLFGSIWKLNGIYIFIFYFMVALKNIKILTYIHDLPVLAPNKRTNFLLKLLFYPMIFFSNTIIIPSPDAQSLLLQYGCKKNKIAKLEIGIYSNLPQMNTSLAKKKLGLTSNKKLLFMWGYFRSTKGYDAIIRAMPHLPQNIILIMIGPVRLIDKNYFEYLLKLINELGLTSRIQAENRRLDSKELTVYMNAADLIILPYTLTTQSSVLTHALAYHKLILTSDVSPFPSIKEESSCIETYHLGDQNDLLTKINQLLYNSNKIREIRKNIAKICLNRSWDSIAKRLLTLCRK